MLYKKRSKIRVKLNTGLFLSLLTITSFFSVTVKSQDIDTTVYTLNTVSTLPEFKGGMELMFKYLQQNVRYPREAQEKNIQGKVYISFTVEKNGKLTNAKIESGPGGGLNEEALRAVKKSPAWTPAHRKDVPVRCRYTIPVSFSLSR